MKKILASVILLTAPFLFAEGDVYEKLSAELKKFDPVTLAEISIEVDLTNQLTVIHKGTPNGKTTAICSFPCSTGPGKFEMLPPGMKTVIYEAGPGAQGNRPSNQFGGIMRHCLRLRMKNKDGSEAYVAFHSANGNYVPRIPTTHGCIRLPDMVANALFAKIGDGKGGVKREVPVVFTGTTPVLDFGNI